MDTPANRKAAKKRRLREKRATAHKPTAADDAATSSLSNSPAIDLSTTTSTDTDNSISTATLSASEDVTPAPLQPPEPLWDSLSDTHREVENYYCKQLLRTAPIAAYLIVEPPEYTETVTPPAQSARDNGDTVEQVDAKLLRMEQHWAESRSSPFPESIRSAIADLRLAVERKETEAAWDAAVQVCAVHAAELEEQSEEGLEEEESERRLEEENERRIDEEQQPTFDWATDIDQSIGPVPSVTDFRPTTPPQTVRTLPAPTDCKPAAYTPTTPALVNPDPGDTACAPSLHDVAPASTAPTDPTPVQSMHMSMVPTDPAPALPKPPLVNPEPAPRHSVQASFIPVDPAPVYAPSVPTTSVHVSTSPAVRTNPIASTMPAARALRDLSGLKSGARNPWSNLSHRRSYIHPPRDLSSLRSSTLNPWSSLRHRNHRSHLSHPHRYSDSEPLRHSHSNPLHPEPARLPTNPESHFPVQSPIEPVQLFQIIQHPRGISLNKPKISKTVSPTPAKFQKKSCTARCACGNIIPTYNPDRRSWRRMDIRRRRFEGGFDSRFRRRFSRRFSRRFCDW